MDKIYHKISLSSDEKIKLFIRQARTWIGTPFKHQASQKKVDDVRKGGADCVGFLYGVAKEVDFDIIIRDKILKLSQLYTPNYSCHSAPDKLIKWVDNSLGLEKKTIEQMTSGDIVVMKTNAHPHHVGIVAEYQLDTSMLSVIHAKPGLFITEERITNEIRSSIVLVYRLF